MNGYVCFYKTKRIEVYSDTSYHAQIEAARLLRVKKTYEITVVLAEKDDKQVTHTPID